MAEFRNPCYVMCSHIIEPILSNTDSLTAPGLLLDVDVFYCDVITCCVSHRHRAVPPVIVGDARGVGESGSDARRALLFHIGG